MRPPKIIHDGEPYYACLGVNGKYYYKGYGRLGMRALHRVIWETFNGPIPKGMHIHHINEDTTDNRIENLAMLSKTAHFNHHHTKEMQSESGRKKKGQKIPANRRGDSAYYSALAKRRSKKP